MVTNSSSTPNVIPLQESWALAIAFPVTADAKLIPGTPVALAADGTVDAVAADGTEFPIGIVVRGNVGNVWEDKVTVLVNFLAVINATANGAIDTADLVVFHDMDPTTGVLEFELAVADEVAIGIALSDALTTETVQIGILRSPITIPGA